MDFYINLETIQREIKKTRIPQTFMRNIDKKKF